MISALWNYRARVQRVIDADTIDLDFDLGFNASIRERVRLARINAWEIRGEQREAGLEAADFVRKAVHAEYSTTYPLLVATKKGRGGTDKYGRWIAEIWLPDGTNLSDSLVAAGHAEYREY